MNCIIVGYVEEIKWIRIIKRDGMNSGSRGIRNDETRGHGRNKPFNGMER